MAVSAAIIALYARFDLVTHTIVEGALYGFAFALYILCARLLYLQLSDKSQDDQQQRKQSLFTLVYMSLVMVMALLGLIVDGRNAQTSYVDHADYPGGGFFYGLNVYARLPICVMGYATSILFEFLIFSVQIWRLWVIWRTSRYSFLIVIVPILSLLAEVGSNVTVSVVTLVREDSDELQRLGYALIFVMQSLMLAIDIIVSLGIIVRIILVRRQHIKVMGQTDVADQYTSIISLLVESFALTSVWMIMTTIFSSLGSVYPVLSAIGSFFLATQPFIQLIAYLLVVYRVSMGRGWKKDTERKLTTLQWNRDEPQTTEFSTRASLPVTQEEA
ncbi:hypothetical protein D9756_006750 [Leucocoprinus leucothites]|uniref:Uncharacterized protein n=1 Tax=Leucocoprinus leucothites TaxID=201217 RepID=A0A8H5LH40_9AGAR|nr:hypothetical protein D9756_006750 [Leucoagaricus leucothites]